jgi:hypothetical protein
MTSLSINWYQRNYPYAWAGARLVLDLKAQDIAKIQET